MAFDACDKWAAEPDRLALIHERGEGDVRRYTFGEIKSLSDRAASLFRSRGIDAADRVAVLLGQEPETAITHLAAYKIGAIAVPLFTLFGTEALRYRLADSGTRLLVTDRAGASKVREIAAALPGLESILSIDGAAHGADGFHEAM